MTMFTDSAPIYGQDPQIVRVNGMYYMVEALHEEMIVMHTFESLDSMEDRTTQLIWDSADEHQLWSPELHFIDGHWFIYYSASDGRNANHRTKVLGSASFPWGPYFFSTQVGPDRWGIDMSIFRHAGNRYAVWSGWEHEDNSGEEYPQHLYIARMTSPVEIGERVLLASPQHPWESSIAPILEGPQAAHAPDGTLYLFYAANASWTVDYSVGVMELAGQDPMNPLSWVRARNPLLSNAGHGHPVGDRFVYHRKMSQFPGWQDREIVTAPFEWRFGNYPRIGEQ